MYPGSCETKKEAQECGKRMKMRMARPAQWKVEVIENMGWHYRLYGPCAVSIHLASRQGEEERYYCLIGHPEDKPGGGAALWTDVNAKEFKSPQKAFEHMRAKAASICDMYTRHARELRRIV